MSETEFTEEYLDPIRIKTADLRKALDIAPATMSDLQKKHQIKQFSEKGKATKYLDPEDVRTILEARGHSYGDVAKTLAILICKGGTGKSTSCYHLSHRLAAYGNRVLLIDADPQGNVTQAFGSELLGIDLDDTTPILVDVINGDLEIEDCIIDIYENLAIIPSTPANSILDAKIADHPGRNPSLPIKEAIAPILHDYDFIIFDCAPALNVTNYSVINSVDTVLMPVNPDSFSEMSLKQTLDELDKVERSYGHAVDRKIVFTRFDQREYTSLRYLSSIHTDQQPLMCKTIIRTSSDVKNAITKRENLFEYSAKSTARADYDDLAKELMGISQLTEKKSSKKKRSGARKK